MKNLKVKVLVAVAVCLLAINIFVSFGGKGVIGQSVNASVTDTIQIYDTIQIHDTVIEKLTVLPNTRKVDYSYLFSARYELDEMYKEARYIASTASDIAKAKAIMRKAKPKQRKLTRYKKHLVYVK